MSNHQYFRYKIFLNTNDSTTTPTIGRVTIIKNNACTPPGQSFFSPVPAAGNYTLSVTIAGYLPYSAPLMVNGNATQYVDLVPTP